MFADRWIQHRGWRGYVLNSVDRITRGHIWMFKYLNIISEFGSDERPQSSYSATGTPQPVTPAEWGWVTGLAPCFSQFLDLTKGTKSSTVSTERNILTNNKQRFGTLLCHWEWLLHGRAGIGARSLLPWDQIRIPFTAVFLRYWCQFIWKMWSHFSAW